MSKRPTTAIWKAAASRRRGARSARGFSLVELLMALAITAALLTATMVAVDASFKVYAAAAESASTQTTTRLAIHRLLTMLRSSTAHGPLDHDLTADPQVIFVGDLAESPYLSLVDAKGVLYKMTYDADSQVLRVGSQPLGSTDPMVMRPMLGGVTNCVFHIKRRRDRGGIYVLERASIDLSVVPDDDSTLDIEQFDSEPIRVIASTMPRRLD